MAHILVTGAAGFIGRALCAALARAGDTVRAGTRAGSAVADAVPCGLGEIGSATLWGEALAGIDTVIHLANRAHRGGRAVAAARAQEPAAAARLARAAAAAGVRRIVYLSSIKAMGERTRPGTPFRAEDPPAPEDAYGRGKLATEQALALTAGECGIELVILRPPLVYGPGVGANFAALLRLVERGVPLPFAAIDNRRSLIFIGNLVDLVARAATVPEAAGGLLLARDASDLSTPALIRALAAGLGCRARLVAAPPALLAALCGLPGLGPRLARLTQSLEIDDRATRALLGWTPPVPSAVALALTARAFRQN